ncbi:hypothetical protein AAMO2058_000628200 [Amorphochlora amoebiformis]
MDVGGETSREAIIEEAIKTSERFLPRVPPPSRNGDKIEENKDELYESKDVKNDSEKDASEKEAIGKGASEKDAKIKEISSLVVKRKKQKLGKWSRMAGYDPFLPMDRIRNSMFDTQNAVSTDIQFQIRSLADRRLDLIENINRRSGREEITDRGLDDSSISNSEEEEKKPMEQKKEEEIPKKKKRKDDWSDRLQKKIHNIKKRTFTRTLAQETTVKKPVKVRRAKRDYSDFYCSRSLSSEKWNLSMGSDQWSQSMSTGGASESWKVDGSRRSSKSFDTTKKKFDLDKLPDLFNDDYHREDYKIRKRGPVTKPNPNLNIEIRGADGQILGKDLLLASNVYVDSEKKQSYGTRKIQGLLDSDNALAMYRSMGRVSDGIHRQIVRNGREVTGVKLGKSRIPGFSSSTREMSFEIVDGSNDIVPIAPSKPNPIHDELEKYQTTSGVDRSMSSGRRLRVAREMLSDLQNANSKLKKNAKKITTNLLIEGADLQVISEELSDQISSGGRTKSSRDTGRISDAIYVPTPRDGVLGSQAGVLPISFALTRSQISTRGKSHSAREKTHSTRGVTLTKPSYLKFKLPEHSRYSQNFLLESSQKSWKFLRNFPGLVGYREGELEDLLGTSPVRVGAEKDGEMSDENRLITRFQNIIKATELPKRRKRATITAIDLDPDIPVQARRIIQARKVNLSANQSRSGEKEKGKGRKKGLDFNGTIKAAHTALTRGLKELQSAIDSPIFSPMAFNMAIEKAKQDLWWTHKTDYAKHGSKFMNKKANTTTSSFDGSTTQNLLSRTPSAMPMSSIPSARVSSASIEKPNPNPNTNTSPKPTLEPKMSSKVSKVKRGKLEQCDKILMEARKLTRRMKGLNIANSEVRRYRHPSSSTEKPRSAPTRSTRRNPSPLPSPSSSMFRKSYSSGRNNEEKKKSITFAQDERQRNLENASESIEEYSKALNDIRYVPTITYCLKSAAETEAPYKIFSAHSAKTPFLARAGRKLLESSMSTFKNPQPHKTVTKTKNGRQSSLKNGFISGSAIDHVPRRRQSRSRHV